MSRPRGFTALEVIVTIGIVGIITIITMPLLVNYQKTTKLRSEGRLIATNIRLAQQKTVTEQINYQVKFLPDLGTYQIINTKTNEIYKTVTLESEVTIYSVTGFTNRAIEFNPTGAALETGTIILTNTAHETSTISVKPSGYVQITD